MPQNDLLEEVETVTLEEIQTEEVIEVETLELEGPATLAIDEALLEVETVKKLNIHVTSRLE